MFFFSQIWKNFFFLGKTQKNIFINQQWLLFLVPIMISLNSFVQDKKTVLSARFGLVRQWSLYLPSQIGQWAGSVVSSFESHRLQGRSKRRIQFHAISGTISSLSKQTCDRQRDRLNHNHIMGQTTQNRRLSTARLPNWLLQTGFSLSLADRERCFVWSSHHQEFGAQDNHCGFG